MILNDIRKEFYDIVYGKRVLVLVNFDVDAVCASKILQYCFQCDHVVYTLVPVQGKDDLIKAFSENAEKLRYVVMINCGGNIDVVETLQPDDDVIFFIADSHRPYDVCNVYNDSQIHLLMKSDDDENIPAFEDIFREEESEDEELDSDSEQRRRFDEETIQKRREKRMWEERRHKILFDYAQFSYYGQSVAVLMFELAWRMSKDNNDLLWWAIVGLSEQFMLQKIENQNYILDSGNLQNHVSRLNHQREDEENVAKECMKIAFDKELRLAMYRHWSMSESLRYTMYTACKFKLWTLKGEKKLLEFLAELGLPLVQCQQKYGAMDMALKSNLMGIIESKVEKYHLQDIVYGSFIAQYGYRNKYSASDMVYAMLALMESVEKDITPTNCFLDAMECLSRSRIDLFEKGLEKAKKQLMAMFKQMQTFLDMNQVISAGPFLYAVIQEGTPDVKFFSHPHCLLMLAKFTLQAHVTVSRSKKAHSLPLVLTAPYDVNEGICLIVGIPPVSEDSPKNFFGKAFEQVAEKTNSRAVLDCFDTSVIQLKTEDRSKFFDALIALLS